MNNDPSISEAEWEIMQILWEQAPCTASEVTKELEGRKDWSPKTIRTLLDRLVKKNVISFHKDKVYAYYPLLSKEECLRAERGSFMKRVYGGAFKPLLVHFIKDVKMSKKDIAELKKILDEEA